MKRLYRFITIVLIPLFFIHCWTYTINPSIVYAEKKTIYKPETEEPEPKPEVVESEKKSSSGWWYVIGAAILAGAAGVLVTLIGGKEEEKTPPAIK